MKRLSSPLILILAIPLIVFLIVFFYIPLVVLALNAFYARNDFSISSVIEVLTSEAYLSIMFFSGEVALITTICTLLVAYPVALYVTLYSRGVEKVLLLVLLITPFWIDVLLRSWSLKVFLYSINIHEGYIAMVIGMVYDYLPFMFIPIAVSLSRIPLSLIEAARTLGAKQYQVLIKIILPNSLPGIVVGCLLVFLMSYTEIVIPSLLGGVAGTTVGTAIYRLVLEADRWSDGATLALTITVLGLVIAVLARRLTGKIEV